MTRIKVAFLFAALVAVSVSPSQAAVDFAAKGKALALEIATNPGGFLYDLHQLSESVAPTRVGRRFSLDFNMIPAILPFTIGNLNGRLNLLSEHPGIPQVEVFGGISQMMALSYLDTEEAEGKIAGKHYGASIVWSAHSKARVQVGYEVSTLDVNVTKKKEPLDVFGTKISEIKVGIEEKYALVGAELLRGNRRYLFTQMAYGLNTSRIIARVYFQGRVFFWGFTVFPESALVIYPNWGFRIGF